VNGARAHQVRLIGGQWKRSKLPVADRPGLRPTPDRVRETLFNWLGQDLGGWRCLDAFAGSGALGFEAASRGAAEVVLLERDGELARSLRASQSRLQALAVRVEVADALAWMAGCAPSRFELVLLDPPFDAGLMDRALALAAPLVALGGYVYVEAGEPVQRWPATLEPWRQARAGQVHFGLLRRNG
jgi:16S rRNA (guanine966-N2)-methyltransferase